MIVKDIELIENFEILTDKKIILYGAGDYGRRAKNILDSIAGTCIEAFCVSSLNEWKEKNKSDKYLGIRVKSINELEEMLLSDDYIIIVTVCSKYREAILDTIFKKVPSLESVYTWFGLRCSFELNIEDDRVDKEKKNDYMLIKKFKNEQYSYIFTSGIKDCLVENCLKDNSIMIFQPGKVGSSTIRKSLFNINRKCNHIHVINSKNRLIDSYKNKSYDKLAEAWKKNYKKDDMIKIISLVRDPLARNISYFFELFHDDFIVGDLPKKKIYESIINYIKVDSLYGKYGYEFEWFNLEIKELFDIDIYQYNFDRDKGYMVIKKGDVELLLLTMEKMNDNEKVIADFVEDSNFKLVNSNVGSEKEYKYAYKEVLNNIVIDKEILDFYYKDNEYMDYFYTEEQKKAFRKRWER